MREFRQLVTGAIYESSTNPRRTFSAASLEELAAGVRRHGVLQPVLVRPNSENFTLTPGALRLRVAKLAGCDTVPARVFALDDAAADEAAIIENLHLEDIHPLEEGERYQRLMAAGRTIDDLAAKLGKSKGYVYQRVGLARLVRQAQDLLTRDVLPLSYALKIAAVPAERQADALAQCFRPLFRDEGGSSRSARIPTDPREKLEAGRGQGPLQARPPRRDRTWRGTGHVHACVHRQEDVREALGASDKQQHRLSCFGQEAGGAEATGRGLA